MTFNIISTSASCHHDPCPLLFFDFFAFAAGAFAAGFVAGVLAFITFFLIDFAGLLPVERAGLAASFDTIADGAAD